MYDMGVVALVAFVLQVYIYSQSFGRLATEYISCKSYVRLWMMFLACFLLFCYSIPRSSEELCHEYAFILIDVRYFRSR